MKIAKYENSFQFLRYTKLFRFPMWLLKKIKFLNIDPQKEIEVPMRIGHKMILKPAENYLKVIAYSGQYHDDNIFLTSRFIKKNSVVFDIGANIGLYSCAYAQYFSNKNLTIYAFEPVKNNFELLNRNIKLNNFGNIKTYNIAFGKEKGRLEFVLPNKNYVGNAVGNNIEKQALDDNTYTESVDMVTLDEWTQTNNIDRCDFIKIDIEGAEFFTFLGGKKFIAKTRPVIQSEYNKYWLEQASVSIQDIAAFFSELDYKIAIERDNHFILLEDFNISDPIIDLLFIPNEKFQEAFA